VDQYASSGKRLLLIVGAPRSGTTWLHMLLTRSPAIASAFETHLFSGYMRSNFERWRRWAAEDHVMGLHRLMDEAVYFGLLRDFAASVLAKVAENKPGASFILEKTPAHAAFAEDILALFPDAFFIHLIRDPRAVVASLLAASRGWASDLSGIGVAEACEIWVRSVRKGQHIASLTGSYIEVQYEELLREGPATLQHVFERIGSPISRSQCEEFVAQCSFDTVHPRSGERENTAVPKLPSDFFRSGKADSWRRDLSPAQIALVEGLAGPVMRPLGYTAERGAGFRSRVDVATARARKAASWRLARLARRLWVQ
jgi:hypothetical protein